MNPLNQRNSRESICLRAFLLVLDERDMSISTYGDSNNNVAKEEENAASCAGLTAKCGNIPRRYIDLMAKVIHGMGYHPEGEGKEILAFFKTRMV